MTILFSLINDLVFLFGYSKDIFLFPSSPVVFKKIYVSVMFIFPVDSVFFLIVTFILIWGSWQY